MPDENTAPPDKPRADPIRDAVNVLREAEDRAVTKCAICSAATTLATAQAREHVIYLAKLRYPASPATESETPLS